MHVLLGREQERLAIDRLLAEARAGRSGVLALVGEPGIGKTALLEHATDRAGDIRVLRARGVEPEAEVPFAALAELLRPALAGIDRIPAPQSAALSGALALGPTAAADRFAIGAATLSLLSAHADAGPLLVVVDDAQLLDRSSAEALLFAFRRLVDDPIAVLLAVRQDEPSLLDGADLRMLQVGGLTRVEAGELLALLPGDTIDRLYLATAGNPLALLELAGSGEKLAGQPVDSPVPISTSIAVAFGRRLEPLSPRTRRALLVAAAGDSRDLAVVARAASLAGADIADLAEAEQTGLVALSDRGVEFMHPLVRSAVYAGATADERRAAHAAVAAALPDMDADRRAWHLAAAAVGPDDAVSRALEESAGRARDRSAYAVAAGTYERAARLAAPDDARGRLLYAAADAAWLAGEPDRAWALLDAAAACTADRLVLARVEHLRGHVLLRRGPVADGCGLLAEAAERVADLDPELAVVMLAESVQGGLYAGDTAAMCAAAERAGEIVEAAGTPRARFLASMAQAMADVARGEGEQGSQHARRAVAILGESDELREDPGLLPWAMLGPMYLREAEAGRDIFERVSTRARMQGAAGELPGLLQLLARDQSASEKWAAAEANLDEAVRLAGETGQRTELAGALAGLAWLEARQGREQECLAHAERASRLCTELRMGTFAVWVAQARGDLELGLGRPHASIEHHEGQVRMMREHGIADVDLSPAPELVDAYLRIGCAGDAVRVASEYVTAAEAKGQPWALARAARCRGMLAEGRGAEAAFDEALELHQRTPDVFETARTRLAYGSRLRREGQRSRSREQLREGFEVFDRLGAGPWVEQARAELAATGETARRRDPSTLDDLTPQEYQIARLLAGGMTTREAAAAAFLSPKTVEYHQRNTYRKLGIHSREELAERLGGSEGATPSRGRPTPTT